MGTRDDEYDYLFKGAPGGVQTGEVAVATGGPKPCYENRAQGGARGFSGAYPG